jgi:hypothetical protein
MIDVDTFLTALYVMVDDFCHSLAQKQRHPGPSASLSPTEVVTLAIFARWGRFASERDFYRYADAYLRDAFPTLPDRSQFNRCVRLQLELIEDVALHLAIVLGAPSCTYEALDSSAMPVRDAKRRGAKDGLLVFLTLVGLTAEDGTRALSCSSPSIREGSSRASVSGPPARKTSRWPRRSSLRDATLTLDCVAWARPPRGRTW